MFSSSRSGDRDTAPAPRPRAAATAAAVPTARTAVDAWREAGGSGRRAKREARASAWRGERGVGGVGGPWPVAVAGAAPGRVLARPRPRLTHAQGRQRGAVTLPADVAVQPQVHLALGVADQQQALQRRADHRGRSVHRRPRRGRRLRWGRANGGREVEGWGAREGARGQKGGAAAPTAQHSTSTGPGLHIRHCAVAWPGAGDRPERCRPARGGLSPRPAMHRIPPPPRRAASPNSGSVSRNV